LQHFNANSQFPEHEIPLPPDFTFSKDNRPVTNHDMHIFGGQRKHVPFCSAVCTPLNLAYNTFAVCNLTKPTFILEISASVLLSGLSASYHNAHTTLPNSTQTPIPILSFMYWSMPQTLHTAYQLHHIF
jgi:hypothetical protein